LTSITAGFAANRWRQAVTKKDHVEAAVFYAVLILGLPASILLGVSLAG